MMTISRLGIPLFGTILLLAACGAVAPTPPQSATPGLGGTSWQLVKFLGSDDKTLTPDDKAKYTIEFGTDGGLSARVDCNRGRGTWKSSGPSQLQLSPLALMPARVAPRSDRQELELRPVLCHQGWSPLSVVDGGWRHLRVRADDRSEIGIGRIPTLPITGKSVSI